MLKLLNADAGGSERRKGDTGGLNPHRVARQQVGTLAVVRLHLPSFPRGFLVAERSHCQCGTGQLY